jgi:hypothetical protein
MPRVKIFQYSIFCEHKKQLCDAREFKIIIHDVADFGCRAVQCVAVRSLGCCECGFESRRDMVVWFVGIFVFCPVEVSATDLSLVHRGPIECGVSEYDREV